MEDALFCIIDWFSKVITKPFRRWVDSKNRFVKGAVRFSALALGYGLLVLIYAIAVVLYRQIAN